MKLGIIVPGGFDRSGRKQVIPALLWLVERLALRHEVHVFVVGDTGAPDNYPLLGAMVHDLGLGAGAPGIRFARRWLELTRALRHVARSGAWDVLHAFWAGSSGLLTALAGHRFGVATVVSIAGGELVSLPEIGYGEGRSRHRRMTVTLSLRLADVVTAGSRYVLQSLPRRQMVEWLPLGVDISRFETPVARSAGPPWRLLHVGAINRVKDQTTLLRGLRLIVDQEPRVRLDWVGEDTLAGAMGWLCEKLGLRDHVMFHGFLPTDEIAPLYRAAHLHLLSSRHESQAVVVGEAAAAGVPTVGTRVGIVDELAPSAAYAVPIGDPAALAEGALALLRDSARRERIGQAAQDWSRQHDADWTAAQFEAIYSRVAR